MSYQAYGFTSTTNKTQIYNPEAFFNFADYSEQRADINITHIATEQQYSFPKICMYKFLISFCIFSSYHPIFMPHYRSDDWMKENLFLGQCYWISWSGLRKESLLACSRLNPRSGSSSSFAEIIKIPKTLKPQALFLRFYYVYIQVVFYDAEFLLGNRLEEVKESITWK